MDHTVNQAAKESVNVLESIQNQRILEGSLEDSLDVVEPFGLIVKPQCSRHVDV